MLVINTIFIYKVFQKFQNIIRDRLYSMINEGEFHIQGVPEIIEIIVVALLYFAVQVNFLAIVSQIIWKYSVRQKTSVVCGLHFLSNVSPLPLVPPPNSRKNYS